MARYLTIRNVPDELAERLEEEKRTRGRSLNQTVLELLAQAVGLGGALQRSNGLAALSGTLAPEEVEELERVLAFTRDVDDELWA